MQIILKLSVFPLGRFSSTAYIPPLFRCPRIPMTGFKLHIHTKDRVGVLLFVFDHSASCDCGEICELLDLKLKSMYDVRRTYYFYRWWITFEKREKRFEFNLNKREIYVQHCVGVNTVRLIILLILIWTSLTCWKSWRSLIWYFFICRMIRAVKKFDDINTIATNCFWFVNRH